MYFTVIYPKLVIAAVFMDFAVLDVCMNMKIK